MDVVEEAEHGARDRTAAVSGFQCRAPPSARVGRPRCAAAPLRTASRRTGRASGSSRRSDSPRATALAPDLRGHGRSGWGCCSIEQHVDDLLETLAAAGVERATVVGHASAAAWRSSRPRAPSRPLGTPRPGGLGSAADRARARAGARPRPLVREHRGGVRRAPRSRPRAASCSTRSSATTSFVTTTAGCASATRQPR